MQMNRSISDGRFRTFVNRLLAARHRRLQFADVPELEVVAHASEIPADTNAQPEAILDLSNLTDWFGGDEKAIEKNLELFMETMKTDLELLTSAIANSNDRDVAAMAHRIRGAASLVGGLRVVACSEAIEASVRMQDWAAIRREFSRLQAAGAEIQSHLIQRGMRRAQPAVG